MSRRLIAVFGAALLLLSVAVVSSGQVQTTTVTKTQTVQNPDGTYTIVEYPVGKETIVTLSPVGITGANGTATVLRAADGTTIRVNLTSLPTDLTALNLYAVDPTGAVSLLGPIELANGVGTFTATTPLSKFMLFTAADGTLTAYDTNTKVFFRSAVPQGLSVIPISGAVGETVAAVTAPTSDYTVPMLGMATFKKGDDTKLKLDFSGPLEGARANVFIERKKDNLTDVRMRFHELKDAPAGQAYTLWAVSPDNQFQQLGTIVNVQAHNEQEIKSTVSFNDFGLLLTTEDLVTAKTLIKPAGHRVGVITFVP
ncbi:MAG TPA: hypothetical protein VJT71_20710 [Pyrinomonadaceae bacterium]|nr:hypothetical protein [Pyrinomonadaceae bacterium]